MSGTIVATGTVNVVGMVNVNVLATGAFLGTADLDGEGGWSIEFDTTFVDSGPITITATPVNGASAAVGDPATVDITVDN